MANDYLKKKIKKYENCEIVAIFILILFSFFTGRYLPSNGWLISVAMGLSLSVAGVAVILLIEHFVKKRNYYKKGLELEEGIAEKLDRLKIEYEPHIETDYGDLDFFIEKNGIYYGVEAKNWAGEVTFGDGTLKVDNWDNTGILSELLMHCKLVRDKKFGEDSGKFIKPMLVFGHKAVVSIPQNKIVFNNVEIIVATVKDFDRYI